MPLFMSCIVEDVFGPMTLTIPLTAMECVSVVAVVTVSDAVMPGTCCPSWAKATVAKPAVGAVNVTVAVTL